MTLLLICVAAAATAAAAVNSGFEVGIYSLSQVRLRHRLAGKDRRAEVLSGLLERPERLISAILMAQNIAVYVTTAIVSSILEARGVGMAEGWSTIVLGFVFFIFVEAVPKNVFRRAGDILVYPLSGVYKRLLFLLGPVVFILRFITRLVLGRAKAGELDGFFTRERLAFYMREGLSEGVLSRYQIELTQNILRAELATVKRAMVAIDKVATVPQEASREDFLRISGESGFSRYPVIGAGGGAVEGIINIYDVYLAGEEGSGIRDVMRPAVHFDESTHVSEALRRLREARQPMGVVMEEGRPAGIVTIKDCVEEIVGELHVW